MNEIVHDRSHTKRKMFERIRLLSELNRLPVKLMRSSDQHLRLHSQLTRLPIKQMRSSDQHHCLHSQLIVYQLN